MTEVLSLFDIPTKPPYSVPLMDQVRARDNGLTAVSTFSGCGGSSTGLHMAGWRIPYAVEFIPAARETYMANWPDTFVDGRDIREIQPREILDAIGLEPGELDLFEGSPPCSSFSIMGTRSKNFGYEKGKGKAKLYSEGVWQVTDDLFDEWLRLVDGLKPRAVLAENVPDLLNPEALPYYNKIQGELRNLGYLAEGQIFKATHFGAATARKRLIIRGYRRDVMAAMPPAPRGQTDRYTIGDALTTLPGEVPADELEWFDLTEYAAGGWWGELQPGQRSTIFNQAKRCSHDEPLPSITAGANGRGAGGAMHPDECRMVVPYEAAYMFGYPADYSWPGTPAQRYERVARSVSPPIYCAHGRALATALGGRSL